MQTRYGTSFLGSISVVALTVLALVATSAPAAGQSAQVTFTRDVAPILQRSCQTCHREGSIAPMSLLTYEEARPWARSISQKVQTRTMPPWYIDKNIGVQGFRYDRSLSDAEIATIVAWVDAGARRGDPRRHAVSSGIRRRVSSWHPGEPDWIVPIPEPVIVTPNDSNIRLGRLLHLPRTDRGPLDQGRRDETGGGRFHRRSSSP